MWLTTTTLENSPRMHTTYRVPKEAGILWGPLSLGERHGLCRLQVPSAVEPLASLHKGRSLRRAQQLLLILFNQLVEAGFGLIFLSFFLRCLWRKGNMRQSFGWLASFSLSSSPSPAFSPPRLPASSCLQASNSLHLRVGFKSTHLSLSKGDTIPTYFQTPSRVPRT